MRIWDLGIGEVEIVFIVYLSKELVKFFWFNSFWFVLGVVYGSWFFEVLVGVIVGLKFFGS